MACNIGGDNMPPSGALLRPVGFGRFIPTADVVFFRDVVKEWTAHSPLKPPGVSWWGGKEV